MLIVLLISPVILAIVAINILSLKHGRPTPVDPDNWHKWKTFFPVRMTNGELSGGMGQLWRRRRADGWEFQQDDESYQDFLDRTW